MQGFNMGRYVPPDVEGTISGNALNRKHALGSRASKLRTEGILTVRFEMPFGVWCGTCSKPTIIGQGVRFNAEKKKVGAYYSTPIWSFRMRHADCGGVIEIRTDPANSEYVVTEGGTRRDTGDDKDDSLVSSGALVGGVGEILTGKEKDALRGNAFATLEKTIEDRAVLIERSHRIAELEDASRSAWEDPYTQNRRLRAAFRAARKAREKEAASMDDLQERMSLGINLLPATEEDARRAALVDFGVGASSEQDETLDGEMNNNRARIHDAALTKPLFASHSAPRGTQHGESQKTTDSGSRSEEQRGKKRLKSEIKAASTRDSLVSSLTRNTRASQDPFILPFIPGPRGAEASTTKSTTTTSRIQGIKRKRPANHPQQSNSHQSPPSSMQTPPKQIREEEGKPEQEADERQQVENRTTDNKTNHRPSGSGSGLLSSSSILEPSKAMATSTSTLVEYDSD